MGKPTRTLTIVVLLSAVSISIGHWRQYKEIDYQTRKQTGVDDKPIYYELSFAECKSLIPQRGNEMITELSLNSEELSLMKNMLYKAINQYNKKVYNDKDFRVDLKNFGVQYIAYLNEKGEKTIWISGFDIRDSKLFNPEGKTNFHFQIIELSVLDGGNGYFSTAINLSNRKIAPIHIHGFA